MKSIFTALTTTLAALMALLIALSAFTHIKPSSDVTERGIIQDCLKRGGSLESCTKLSPEQRATLCLLEKDNSPRLCRALAHAPDHVAELYGVIPNLRGLMAGDIPRTSDFVRAVERANSVLVSGTCTAMFRPDYYSSTRYLVPLTKEPIHKAVVYQSRTEDSGIDAVIFMDGENLIRCDAGGEGKVTFQLSPGN